MRYRPWVPILLILVVAPVCTSDGEQPTPNAEETATLGRDDRGSAPSRLGSQGMVQQQNENQMFWLNIFPFGGDTYQIVSDPHDPSTLYSATNMGLFKTTDAGITWHPVYAFTPSQVEGARWGALAMDPANPNVVYWGRSSGDLGRSEDGGITWERLGDGVITQAVYDIAIDPNFAKMLGDGDKQSGLCGDRRPRPSRFFAMSVLIFST